MRLSVRRGREMGERIERRFESRAEEVTTTMGRARSAMDRRTLSRRLGIAIALIIGWINSVEASSGDVAATCGWESRWETRDAGDAATLDGACGAMGGDDRTTVVEGRNGVWFHGDGGMIMTTGSMNRAVESIVGGEGAFSIEIVVVPDAQAPQFGVTEPLVTFSTSTRAIEWQHYCGGDDGYYLSVWIRHDRVGVCARALAWWAPYQCTLDTNMYGNDVQALSRGFVNTITVMYDITNGVRIAVNGTRTFPPDSFGSTYRHQDGIDVVRAWNASDSRVVVGAYGSNAFTGVIYALRVYDHALSAEDLLRTARESLPISKPYALSINVTCEEDSSTHVKLEAANVLGDAVRFRLVSIPQLGKIFDDDNEAPIVEAPCDLRGSTVRFEPAPNEHSVASAADERFDYASFEFEAFDTETSKVNVTHRATVRVRVVSVNDAPTTSEVHMVAYVGILERIRLPFSDLDVDDQAAAVVITREPKYGSLYSCDGDAAMTSALNLGSSVAVGASPCLAYVANKSSNVDSMEYVIIDSSGARSDPATLAVTIKIPCAALDRHQTLNEDTNGKIRFVAACASSRAVTARIMAPPRHGKITNGLAIVLHASECTKDENTTCAEWWRNASSPSCACGAFDYVPEPNYFNIPGKDIYGRNMSLSGTPAASWDIGNSDTARVRIETVDNTVTDPYVVYISVQNVFDVPMIHIRTSGIEAAGAITPNTTSFALSGAIDMDISPDYDAHAISVTMTSVYAETMALSDARFDWLRPFGGSNKRILRLIGPASAVADALKRAQITYIPRDARTSALVDNVMVRIVIGVRPIVGAQCDLGQECYFQSTVNDPACDAATPPSIPCAIEIKIPVAIADSPAYIATINSRAAQRGGSSRSVQERARVVFAIWFAFGVLTFWLINKCASFARMRAAGAFGF